MNIKPTNSLDQSVLAIAQKAFDRERDSFAQRGLTISPPEIRVWKDATAYTSEITATVYRINDDEIVDIIEMLIHHNGTPTATLEEIREWFDEVTQSIITEVDTEGASG